MDQAVAVPPEAPALRREDDVTAVVKMPSDRAVVVEFPVTTHMSTYFFFQPSLSSLSFLPHLLLPSLHPRVFFPTPSTDESRLT